MEPPSSRAIAVQPPNSPEWVREAVIAGGGHIVEPADASAIVWTAARNASGLREVLDANAHLEWVQVPFAGIENFVPILDDNRIWTCGKGVYAEPVAEHALALALAGMRNISGYSRATQWTGPAGRNLLGAAVTIVGGGASLNLWSGCSAHLIAVSLLCAELLKILKALTRLLGKRILLMHWQALMLFSWPFP